MSNEPDSTSDANGRAVQKAVNHTRQWAKCRYCREQIDSDAQACRFCGRFQSWVKQYLHTGIVSYGGLIISLFVLILGVSQFYEARLERIRAEEALKEAKIANRSTRELALTLSEVLLATLSVNKGRLGDFQPMQLTAPYVRKKVEQIFDLLGLNAKEREERLRIYEAYQEWMKAPDGSREREEAWQNLERLTSTSGG